MLSVLCPAGHSNRRLLEEDSLPIVCHTAASILCLCFSFGSQSTAVNSLQVESTIGKKLLQWWDDGWRHPEEEVQPILFTVLTLQFFALKVQAVALQGSAAAAAAAGGSSASCSLKLALQTLFCCSWEAMLSICCPELAQALPQISSLSLCCAFCLLLTPVNFAAAGHDSAASSAAAAGDDSAAAAAAGRQSHLSQILKHFY